ncbi:MAG: hypothetical protein V9G18_21900 [Albidovulum sp.]
MISTASRRMFSIRTMRRVIAIAQLADRQRLDLLVGRHVAAQDLSGQQAVGVRDIGPGQPEDPRIPREGPVAELRKLPVVARRQVVADLPELLFHEVEVVEQPFRGRGDRLAFLHRPGADAVSVEENRRILPDAPAEALDPRPPGRCDLLGGGKAFGVMLQPFDAEKLGTDRRLVLPDCRRSLPVPPYRRSATSAIIRLKPFG